VKKPGLSQHLQVIFWSCQQARDTKINQPYIAISGYQNVAGFQVPVHDQVMVRVLQRIAHLQHQFQSFGDVAIVLPAPGRNWLAMHKLHDEEWQSVAGGAGIDKARDVGML
jgi:hypothetical protein